MVYLRPVNIYKVEWINWPQTYDTYDSAIIIAESSSEAIKTHPDGKARAFDVNSSFLDNKGEIPSGCDKTLPTWCPSPRHVKVILLGVVLEGAAPGVVCASYNSG